jgi:hypothetical protein
MGRHEKIIPTEPPAPRAPTVLKHLQTSKRALVALEGEVPALLLAVAEERPGAKEGLAALREEIAAAEFEIEHNAKARELAERLDEQAIAAFKAAVQTLSLEEIVEGISKDQCPRRCAARVGCVITGADPLAGPCAHPVLVGSLELHRYRDNPQICAVYAAAAAKLNLKGRPA